MINLRQRQKATAPKDQTYWHGWTRITYDATTGFWVRHSPLSLILLGIAVLTVLVMSAAVLLVTGIWWLALLTLIGAGGYVFFTVRGL